MSGSLTFTAVSETSPGPKWKARWDWSWPAYQTWFSTRSGKGAPSRAECEAALAKHMPELVPVHDRLCRLSGADDVAARFLSGWCPPSYLGGCSIAARADGSDVRLVRNYDLSPDLNEGLLLRSEWTGNAVMGMIEFLWGLSDGINDRGLCVALAFGGRGTTSTGFGITHIVRYVLETCGTVDEAIRTLRRIPSHMAYNLVLADSTGRLASVELQPGGGFRLSQKPVATNHQSGPARAERPEVTRTVERRNHLERLVTADCPPYELRDHFLVGPLFQTDYAKGFGTLFTVEYAPPDRGMILLWPGSSWEQKMEAFEEGTRTVNYGDVMDLNGDSSAITQTPPCLENWYEGAAAWIAYGEGVAAFYGAHAVSQSHASYPTIFRG
jgi:predicted choloylglycine hydrolase